MTPETSTDTTVQTFNDRTEVLSVLGALMHPIHPGSVSVAVDALVTLLAIARKEERTRCLDWLENLLAKADKALADKVDITPADD